MNKLIGLLIIVFFANYAHAEKIGSVDTVFKFLGPDHKIIIEAFDDPDIEGVVCHLSRAKKGGVSGAIGVAEDPADSSIACRQIGPIRTEDNLENGDEVFSKRTSFIFKELHVVRFLDEKRQVLIYLIYSDKVIEGSREHALSTVPITPWGTQAATRLELDD